MTPPGVEQSQKAGSGPSWIRREVNPTMTPPGVEQSTTGRRRPCDDALGESDDDAPGR